MPYEFINNAQIDPKTRKRIRSLVALGKNVGKSIVRPSRKTNAFTQQSVYVGCNTPSHWEDYSSQNIFSLSMNSTLAIQPPVSDGLVFCFATNDLNANSRSLAKRAISFMGAPRHPPELNHAFDLRLTAGPALAKMVLIDEAFFHSSIALSTLAIGALANKSNHSGDAIHHLCVALRVVGKRLSHSSPATPATMASVMMLSQFERHQNQHYQGLVHLNGLRNIVATWGGIDPMQKDVQVLMQKAFRIDLDFALYMGTATVFNVGDVIVSRQAIFGEEYSSLRQPHLHVTVLGEKIALSNLKLANLLNEALSLAIMLNNASFDAHEKLNVYAFNAHVVFLGYQIVALCSLRQSSQLDKLEHAVHLGLANFIVTFLNTLDRKFPAMPYMAKLLRSLLRSGWKESPLLLLWLAFLGDATILDPNDHEWLVPMVAMLTKELNMNTWSEVADGLHQLPWIDNIYNKSGERLWIDVSIYLTSLQIHPC